MIALWSNLVIGDQPENKADSFFQKGAFRKAALLYEKQLFRQPDSLNPTFTLFKKAQCYKQLEEFEKAYETLTRIESSEASDSMQMKVTEESILMPYLAKNEAKAYSEYKEAEINLDSAQLQELGYLKVLVLSEQQKWKKAKKAMKAYAKRKGKDLDIDSLFQKVTTQNAFKDKRTAKVLSLILPGSGQIYAGRFWQGLASFGLTLGTAYFGVNRFLHEYYFATFISGSGLLLRFYSGGVKKTIELVEKSNQEKTEKFQDVLTREILNLKKLPSQGHEAR